MRDLGVIHEVLGGRDDFGDARLVVGPEQRVSGRGDDIVTDVCRERRIVSRAQHRRRIVRQHDVAPVVGPVDDRVDIVALHLGRRVDVCDEADDRHMELAGRRRDGTHHVAMLVHADVGQPGGRELVHEDAQERQLPWRAGAGRRAFVRAGVDDNVAQEALERRRGDPRLCRRLYRGRSAPSRRDSAFVSDRCTSRRSALRMASVTVCHGDDGDSRAWCRTTFHLHEGQGDPQVLDNRVQSLTVVRDPVSEQARREVAAYRAICLVPRCRDVPPPCGEFIDCRRTGEALGYGAERQANPPIVDLDRGFRSGASRSSSGFRADATSNSRSTVSRRLAPTGRHACTDRVTVSEQTERVFSGHVRSREQTNRPPLPGIVAREIGQHSRAQERGQRVACVETLDVALERQRAGRLHDLECGRARRSEQARGGRTEVRE